MCLCNLGQFLCQAGRLPEAEATLRRAVQVDEAIHGVGHASTGTSLNNLALVLRRTGQLDEAEPLYRRVLAIFEQGYGPEHIHVGGVLNNLAQVLQQTNRPTEAEPLMRRAIGIFEKEFGENHPNVAIAVNNLSRLLATAGRLEEAEPLSRRHVRIFQIFEDTTGDRHAYKEPAIQNYSDLLVQMGLDGAAVRQRVGDILAGKEVPALKAAQRVEQPFPKRPDGEPDFDALTRAAYAADGGVQQKNRLFTAALKLEKWHFIARGEMPNVHAYGAANASIANGAPMLKAFTDTQKLHAFAKENQLVREDGSVTILSLPVHNIQPTLEGYAEQGVTHVHLNADRGSNGFYIPIVQLPLIRAHLTSLGLI